MTFEFSQQNGKGKFYLGNPQNPDAEITFVHTDPHTIIADHTYANSQTTERGTGKKLVEQLVTYARENNIKIIPLCPFARAVIEKNADMHDVLKK